MGFVLAILKTFCEMSSRSQGYAGLGGGARGGAWDEGRREGLGRSHPTWSRSQLEEKGSARAESRPILKTFHETKRPVGLGGARGVSRGVLGAESSH